MKTMYTKTPDDGCYPVGNGLHARPVQSDHQKAKLKAGWTYEKPEATTEAQEAEEGQLSVGQEDAVIAAYTEKFGKPPHHKMKIETMLDRLEE